MKQPKRLTRKQKEAVFSYGLNPAMWMLLKDGDVYITIINKKNGKTKIIDKMSRKGKRI